MPSVIVGRHEEVVWGDVKEFSFIEFMVLGMIGEDDLWETGNP